MAVSQNGWHEISTLGTDNELIPGTATRIRLRKGPAGYVLRHLAAFIDREIEDIDTATGKQRDDWGYAYRLIRGSKTQLSFHAFGLAEDLNALRHPLGAKNTWQPWQVARINHELATTYKSLIRWGENYTGRVDGMHFEIIGTPKEIDSLYHELLFSTAPPLTDIYRVTGVTYTSPARTVVVPASYPTSNAHVTPPAARPALVVSNTDQTPKGWVAFFQQLIAWESAWRRWRPLSPGHGYLSAECMAYARQLPKLKSVLSDGVVGKLTWAEAELL